MNTSFWVWWRLAGRPYVVLDESKPLPNRVNWRLVLRSAQAQRAMKKMGKVFSKARLAVVLLVPSKTSRRILRS